MVRISHSLCGAGGRNLLAWNLIPHTSQANEYILRVNLQFIEFEVFLCSTHKKLRILYISTGSCHTYGKPDQRREKGPITSLEFCWKTALERYIVLTAKRLLFCQDILTCKYLRGEACQGTTRNNLSAIK